MKKETQEVSNQQKLIEKLYVKDETGNTVELKTYLCPDGSTRTERRIAINAKGELHGKFKETGVDLSDVITVNQEEINRLIKDNAMKLASNHQNHDDDSVISKKLAVEQRLYSSTEKDSKLKIDNPNLQFNSFQQAPHASPEKPHISKQYDSPKQELFKENLKVDNHNARNGPEQSTPLTPKQLNGQVSPITNKTGLTDKDINNANSDQKAPNSQSKAKVVVPPEIANAIKGKMVKVRYKEHKGKSYPIGISGSDLTKTEKEWLLRRVIEKEGFTLEEVEAIEGGHLIDADDGSEYRLTTDKDTVQHDNAETAQNFYKNQRGSNLVKDIQNQVIKEQDEELVSQSSNYPSQRIVMGITGQEAPVQKFDLMHKPSQSLAQNDDEIWFRTKEQRVLEETNQYKNIDMSKSSRKNPALAAGIDATGSHARLHDADDYHSESKSVNTKFNYGTNQQYNPNFAVNFDTNQDTLGRSAGKDDAASNYDPSDIDALLKHNERLLSKIKIDMKNIGESFVSHTDMGNSRVGVKNNLSGLYRQTDFDSKELLNRSPIGIQEFESFKTKTNDVIFE